MNNSVKLNASVYFKYKKKWRNSCNFKSNNALNCEKIILMSAITIDGTGLTFDSDGDCTLSLHR